jgi:hypothetical protein
MDRGGLAQNVVPPIEVAALFDNPPIEDIHLAPDELGQFLFDLEPIQAGWTIARLEADEEVDIALVVEIVAQERAEDFELGDVPLPAEGCQLPGRDLETLAD